MIKQSTTILEYSTRKTVEARNIFWETKEIISLVRLWTSNTVHKQDFHFNTITGKKNFQETKHKRKYKLVTNSTSY